MSAEIKITVTPDLDALFAGLEGDTHEAVKAGLIYLVETLEAWAAKEVPRITSNLFNSITSYLTNNGMTGIIRATAAYAIYVHEGTGLYGPHRQVIVIVPKNKKALAWPGAKHPVKSVTQKGIHPNPFFNRAIGHVDPPATFAEGVQNYLTQRRAA